MKKILSIIVLAIMAVSASAEYTIFETKGINSSQIDKRELLYVGGYKEYQKNIEEIQKSFVAHGMNGLTQGLSTTSSALAKGFYGEAMQGAGVGIAINLAIAGINWIAAQYKDERVFVKVELLTLKDGSQIRNSRLLVADNFTTLTNEEAIAILQKGTK
jgi:hypothetical protein